jgi:ABC-type uncharacterized transport system permease subunit
VIQGVSIICFAASYAVSLALEVSRLYFQAAVRNIVMVGFAAAGLVAHSLYLTAEVQRGAPLASWYHGALAVAWVLAVQYLGVTLWPSRSGLGLILLPAILILILAAQVFPRHATLSQAQASEIWAGIHAGSLLLGTTAVVLGFFAGLMYLSESERLKLKRVWPYRLRLPSLEWLERATERCLVVSCCLLVGGLVSGILLNVSRSADHRLSWDDPIIWSSALLLLWLSAVLVFNAVYRPARQGRKVAYLTVASFVFLGLVLGLLMWVPAAHLRTPA